VLKCPNPRCRYEWQPRVKRPKVCPKCHRFLTDQDFEKEDYDTEPNMEKTETGR
jgi:ssDNA-binding Zn-finger/Zn-ribbon topoisomerase 1